MELSKNQFDREEYPEGLDLVEVEQEGVWMGTCGWCNRWANRTWQVADKKKEVIEKAWEDHAREFHPARLDPNFNARTMV